MKPSIYLRIWAVALLSCVGGAGALAQERVGVIHDDVENEAHAALQSANRDLPVGHLPRYRATFMKSNTLAPALRTATVVSITNQSSLSCSTSVDFRVGAASVCTTIVTVPPGATVDHCSRVIPTGMTSCNATCSPSLTAHEGHAVIGSTSIISCDNIVASARTYYTGSTTDAPVSAITDAKIVKFGTPNAGD